MSQELTREEAFDQLIARGVHQAVVTFNGGGDEGHVDDIRLFNKDRQLIGELEEGSTGKRWDATTGQYKDPPPPTDDEKLANCLVTPVDDKYGSFNGEFSVEGSVTWNTEDRTITLKANESCPTYIEEQM